MEDSMREDRRIQMIRTYLPGMVAVLIARLVAAVPAVGEVIAVADGIFVEAGWAGMSVLAIVQAIVIAATIVAYQRVAQYLGDRWPAIERLMLGSTSRPHYVPRYAE